MKRGRGEDVPSRPKLSLPWFLSVGGWAFGIERPTPRGFPAPLQALEPQTPLPPALLARPGGACTAGRSGAEADGQQAGPKVLELRAAPEGKAGTLPARARDLGGSATWGRGQSFCCCC